MLISTRCVFRSLISLRYDSWSVIVTNGSQDAFTRAIEMLADPGDALLVEDPTYAGLIAFAVWAGDGKIAHDL